ncbi:hypothetical protein ACIA8O_35490 [Kitasatospora sp. NPDC051853]|uniref:hypothetical protein n=1 Tax=Kitasatospora sp. NPDC051853 TaxID=3364058 RepID=UPI00378F4E1F
MIYRANMVVAVVGVVCGGLLLITAVRVQGDGGAVGWTVLAGGVLLVAVLWLVLEVRQGRRQRGVGSGKE